MNECNCERCRRSCRVAPKRNKDAKMLRTSAVPKGLCVNCATHDWLRNTYPVNMILDGSGPKILLHEHVRKQFSDIMRAANADAKIDEINWNLIVENWELPWRHKVKLSALNPYDPQRDGPAEQRRRQELLKRMNESDEERRRREAIRDLPTTITSFDQLNVIEPGLGDSLKSALLISSQPGQIEVVPVPPEPTSYETYTPGCFSGCRFCGGKGCAGCDGEYAARKKRQ